MDPSASRALHWSRRTDEQVEMGTGKGKGRD